MMIETTYIDATYGEEYPQFTPVPIKDLEIIEQSTEPWQRFMKPELQDRNIQHITIRHAKRDFKERRMRYVKLPEGLERRRNAETYPILGYFEGENVDLARLRWINGR